MNFDNMGYIRFYLTDYIFITINDTLISTWLIGALLIALAIVVRIKIKNFKAVPETKFQNIIEAIVEMFDNYVVSIMTKRYRYFGPWFFGLFIFFLLSNLSGLTGLRNPTADLALTLSMGITTLVLMQFVGIKDNTRAHFKSYLAPVFIFLPLNIASDLAKAVSLSMRLFVNILSGMFLMGFIYYVFPWFLSIGIPGGLSLFFDVFMGVLQAFIFVTISMFYIAMNTPEEA